ncbi:type II secretion system F family protein [Saccharopolyspora sp. NFXS83]|uniref:type II secretion system F family protein n=1 Tax=Saccharopolyspora sp. NFXS83 TaxID=2993560 RepID=UPI00224B7292|nr:type II secretion system F family protein [Saccharopolyspora sp. NFXS83]MCX2732866.1 type II secretion system F family protein [Saccharopolyspora sp. NFXS83]
MSAHPGLPFAAFPLGGPLLPWAMVLFGAALLAVPRRRPRARLPPSPDGPGRFPGRWLDKRRAVVPAAAAAGVLGALVGGPAVGFAVAAGVLWWLRRAARQVRPDPVDPLVLAAGWDLLAAGMRAGLPPVVLVRAVAAEFTGTASAALREVAGLLELGADPAAAWEPALRHPGTAELGRAARRTARTGSALAEVATELAAEARTALADRAQARAQRAAVWVAAPLGLCFLPAFLCLGVLPVVVGMVQRLPMSW